MGAEPPLNWLKNMFPRDYLSTRLERQKLLSSFDRSDRPPFQVVVALSFFYIPFRECSTSCSYACLNLSKPANSSVRCVDLCTIGTQHIAHLKFSAEYKWGLIRLNNISLYSTNTERVKGQGFDLDIVLCDTRHDIRPVCILYLYNL